MKSNQDNNKLGLVILKKVGLGDESLGPKKSSCRKEIKRRKGRLTYFPLGLLKRARRLTRAHKGSVSRGSPTDYDARDVPSGTWTCSSNHGGVRIRYVPLFYFRGLLRAFLGLLLLD